MEVETKKYKKRKLCKSTPPVKTGFASTPRAPISIRNVSSTGKCQTKPSKSKAYYSLSDIHTPTTTYEEIPDTLSVSYVNDFNLIKVHETILRKLKAESNQLTQLKSDLSYELDTIQKPQTIIERNKSIQRIKHI